MHEFGCHGNKSPLTAFPQNDASIVYETGINNFPKETRFRQLFDLRYHRILYPAGRSKTELHKYNSSILGCNKTEVYCAVSQVFSSKKSPMDHTNLVTEAFFQNLYRPFHNTHLSNAPVSFSALKLSEKTFPSTGRQVKRGPGGMSLKL